MPQFNPGELKTARVPMTNPTAKAFDYAGFIYMGTDLAVMSQVDFHLEAGEAKDISLPVIMPAAVGTYPVYIGVFSGGVNIGLYRATEDVTVVSIVGWVSPTGHIDPTGLWASPQSAYDDDVTTSAGISGMDWAGIPIELTLDSPIYCDKVRINAASYWQFEYLDPDLSVDVYYEGAYHNIKTGVIPGSYYSGGQVIRRWVELPIPAGMKLVSKARIKWNENLPVSLWEFDFYKCV